MNFVDVAIQFQSEVDEEDPNHPHMKLRQMVLYSEPSDVVAGKQTGMVQGMLRKALGPIKHDFCQKREDSLDRQANDPEDIGILVGEVYDEKIIEECLHMGRNSINELLVNIN